MRYSLLFMLLCLLGITTGICQKDTIWIKHDKCESKIKWKHKYHQTLTIKLMLATCEFDGEYKRSDNDENMVFLTINDAFEVIKKIDRVTLGIPKIIYLVGWQYNGHDSMYPAWFEGNERLKRPQDKNTLESIRWLMNESQKYNTTISLHINMFDAYEDSPLWNTYVANDIIARNEDGSLLAGEWGYPISYAQEWETGLAQQRIDSLCNLLPLKEAGTVHIDAFHTWPPVPVKDEKGEFRIDIKRSKISPYLDFTVADETEAQEKIFRYWAQKGIDVTSEGVGFLRETSFEGFQPMAWWFSDGLESYIKWPASYYCGGQDNSVWGKLFGTSMHGESIVKNDPVGLNGFAGDFCLKTLPWYYLNRLERIFVVDNDEGKTVSYEGDVMSQFKDKSLTITKGKRLLLENGDLLMPALWIDEPQLVAYSENGYELRKWILPKSWPGNVKVELWEVGIEGLKRIGSNRAKGHQLTLTLKPGQMLIIKQKE
ncbi:hypothetical protein EYV94_18300 [Puteibacter caeruleilacunae]|nr:hypothetical protein EYV94_18300 [Puteibacter caeruleilacunae]